MLLLRILQLLLAVSLTSQDGDGNSHCASFRTLSITITGDRDNYATVDFTINNTCTGDEGKLKLVKVFSKTTPHLEAPICKIKFADNKCSFAVGCTCDKAKGILSLRKQVDSPDSEVLLLVGELKNADIFDKTVRIPPSRSIEIAQQTVPSEFPVTNDGHTSQHDFSLFGVQDIAPETTTYLTILQDRSGDGALMKNLDDSQDFRFFVLLGSIGFVLLLVAVLFVVVGVVLKKRGRHGRFFPPPNPHNTRWAADAVAFRAQPAPPHANDVRDSVLGHVYNEIPDDTDSSTSENNETSTDATEQSAMLPDDYLHPITTAGEQTIVSALVTPTDDPSAPGATASDAAGGTDLNDAASTKSAAADIAMSTTEEAIWHAPAKPASSANAPMTTDSADLTPVQISHDVGTADAVLTDPPYENTKDFP